MLLFLFACSATTETSKSQTSTPKSLPPTQINIKTTELPPANFYMGADLNGDGKDELIYADQDGLRYDGNMEPIQGVVQIGVRGDYNQDGKEDIFTSRDNSIALFTNTSLDTLSFEFTKILNYCHLLNQIR